VSDAITKQWNRTPDLQSPGLSDLRDTNKISDHENIQTDPHFQDGQSFQSERQMIIWLNDIH
jgi:hypothetical protein